MAEISIDGPLRGLAAAIRNHSTTAVSLARQAIDRHKTFGGPLNGYRHWDEAAILASARAADGAIISGGGGALAGIPVSVKDIYALDAMPLFGGMAKEVPEPWRNEGPLVQALRAQRAVFTGKTHSTELALGAVGHNIHLDVPPRNPWDVSAHRLCGGSSIGASVSIAEGSAIVAMGSDTGGSVRNPASLAGCVGFKPTHGRWSSAGLVPASPAFDTPGVLTRSAEDAAFAFAALDPSAPDPESFFAQFGKVSIGDIRIGVVEDYFWDKCEASVASVVRAAIGELARCGAKVIEVPLPEAAEARKWYGEAAIFAVEALSFLMERYPDRLASLDPLTAERFAAVKKIDASTYYTGLRKIAELAARAGPRLRDIDVIVTPTIPIGAPLLSDMADLDVYREANFLIGYNTQPINLLGLCTMTLPAGLDRQGLPAGLQLAAGAMQDERLLASALAFERVLGTSRQRLGIPPMCSG